MSSTRLPGKVLADVDGEPLLGLLLRRLAGSQEIGRVVVATSTDAEDDALAAAAAACGADVHRGPLEDVLGRVAGAARGHAGPVVRLTADCPLLDPAVVDQVVALFRSEPDLVYGSNVEPRTYPDGLDVEVLSSETLARLAATVTDPVHREHVTSALRAEGSRHRTRTLVAPDNLGHLRWTVDTMDDLLFVRQVVVRLGARRHVAGMAEVLAAARAEPSLAGGGARA